MAALLEIDTARPLMTHEVANLFNGETAQGNQIEGRVQLTARPSIAEIFGITDLKAPPSGEAFDNIMRGLRVDGGTPMLADGPVQDRRIDGARRYLLTALHVQNSAEPTIEELARLRAGLAGTDGMVVNAADYSRTIQNTHAPIAYLDCVLSPDKSLSVAWALAPTGAERALLLRVHKDAVASTMAYFEETIGFRQRGAAGERAWEERGEITWIMHHHYTARPAAEIATVDKDGVAYTEVKEVPTRQADPHLHTHIAIPSVVLTPDGGVGKLNLDRLDGMVKELGAVYHAYIAKYARRHGVDVEPGPTGEARLVAVPERVRADFSRRTQEAERAAKEMAAEQGLDWDQMTAKHKLALLERGKAETREAKREGPSDFARWRAYARDTLGYDHHSVLRPDDVMPELVPGQRHETAYKASLPWVEEAFDKRATMPAAEVRVLAARGLIVGGIDDPAKDIAAVTKHYREQGINQGGGKVALLWAKAAPHRRQERWDVSTDLNLDQEHQVLELARSASADRSAALTPEQIDHAVRTFLAKRPEIDQDAQQWRDQRAMLEQLATGGRLAVGIGSAGSGKSTILSPLVNAWQSDGRTVFGVAVAWRQAGGLGESGIAKEHLAALAAFVRRVETGRYKLDSNTVVVIDEVSLVGTRQMLNLLKLRDRLGFQVVAIGDPKQCQSIEAGPVMDLTAKALPGAIPAIVTSVRQRTQHERNIANLFRDGRTDEALAMKREDGHVALVAGGKAPTVQRAAALWRERVEANQDDPSFTISVSTSTRADAREVSAAIRAQLQDMGRVGPDRVTVQCMNNEGERYELPIAVGDLVRPLRRIYPGKVKDGMIANNGDVLRVLDVSTEALTARNAEGRQARLGWKVLSDSGGPLRLAPGYAATIDSQQGMTSTEHINVIASGSSTVQGFKNYVAESRHRVASWMIVNESAERQQIRDKRPANDWTKITGDDVWANIAKNLSRQPTKSLAMDFLCGATSVHRGTITQRFAGRVHQELAAAKEASDKRGQPVWTASADLERRRVSRAPALRRVAEQAREIALQGIEKLHLEARQARGPRL
ncbi:MobF family relaxase [Acidisphaera sp. S103]|uniref:MobF family relaxase n=1 Tax=Acidisphaera sp. S103 TaxID=1747223 RepID=UPI00352D3646